MSSSRDPPGSQDAQAYELVTVAAANRNASNGRPAEHSRDSDDRPPRVHRRRRFSQSGGQPGTDHVESVGLLAAIPVDSLKAIRGSSLRIALELVTQSSPSLLCAVFGSVMTGFVFDQVQFWPAFLRITELFILVPVLLNLKGCLEMNLASRLSTSVQSTLHIIHHF
jgi:hypothetical protein